MTNIISEYKNRIVIFGSRNAINDPEVVTEGTKLAKFCAENNYIVATGGSSGGVMGHVAKVAYESGGETLGIGLHNYEPYNSQEHYFYTNHEGYTTHWERQRRLIEVGDIFIAFKGGFGTLHEVIDIYLMQGLLETRSPLILIGEYMENFQLLIEFFEKHKMGRHMQLGSNLHYVKNAEEATLIIEKHIKEQKLKGYYGPDFYPAMSPEGIYEHVRLNPRPFYVAFEKIRMKVLPDVYPSNRFRSSRLLGSYVKRRSQNKKVLDMGCGSGTMGIVAAMNGASSVVQVDLNPLATRNARENAEELCISEKIDIYNGNGFKPIAYKYKGYFDIIFFNPPFHSIVESSDEKTELMYAFYTQGLEGGILDSFFRQAPDYLATDGELIIAFSNKDLRAMRYLEESMKRNGFSFKIEILSEESNADVRVYQAKHTLTNLPKPSQQKSLKIGLLLAESGNARADGTQMKKAIEMATDELRAAGLQIELGFVDDQSTLNKSVSGAVKLLEEFKPDAIIGPTWSTYIDGVAKYFEDHSIPYYIPATSLDILESNNLNYVLAGAQSIKGKADTLRNWMDTEGYLDIIHVTRTDVLWGRKHQLMLQKLCQSSGKKYLHLEIPKDVDNTKLAQLTESFSSVNKPIIVIDNYEDFFYNFIEVLKDKGLHSPLVCLLNIAEELKTAIKRTEPPFALYELTVDTPKKFVEKFFNRYKEVPSRYAFNAYVGVYALSESHRVNPNWIRRFIIQDWSSQIYEEDFKFTENGQITGRNWQLKRLEI